MYVEVDLSPAGMVGDGVSRVAWRLVRVALSCVEMMSVVFPTSSFHWDSKGWGMGN